MYCLFAFLALIHCGGDPGTLVLQKVVRCPTESSRGSATPVKMGGTGTRRQRSQDFLQRITHTKNRKLSGFGPLFS